MASLSCGALRVPRIYTQPSQALSFTPRGSGLRLAWPFPGCLAQGPMNHLPPYMQDTPSLSTVYKWMPPHVPGLKEGGNWRGWNQTLETSVPITLHPSLPPCYQNGWRREGAILSRAATERSSGMVQVRKYTLKKRYL